MHCIQKKEESGRSMIEMLAVLAVMGLLTVTGLFFYRSAINKHKAVEIYGAVGVAHSQLLIKQIPADKTVSGVRIKAVGDKNLGDNAAIRIDFGDDTALCKELQSMYGDNPEFAFVGDCS